MRDLDRHPRDEFADDEGVELTPALDVRDLLRLHPRLLLAAAMVAVVMFPVGLFLAALAIGVLKVSGGAAHDTSIVVAMTGYVVADFWGGGIVTHLTRARAPQVAAAWGVARAGVLVLVALAAPGLLAVVPIQLLLAIPAAWAGARVARKQAALKRQIRVEQARAAERAAAREPRATADALR
jgi:hypothetical protein